MCIALKKMRRSLIIGRLLLTRGFLYVYLVISINEGKEGLIFLFMPVSQSAVFVWHRDDVITSASSSPLLSASFHHWLINLIIGGIPYKNRIRCERCCYSDVTHWNSSLSAQVIPYLLIEIPKLTTTRRAKSGAPTRNQTIFTPLHFAKNKLPKMSEIWELLWWTNYGS